MSRSTPLEVLADGLRFPEGLRWHDGRLYASDVYDHVVYAFSSDGRREVICEVPDQPSGLGFTPRGELLISSMTDRRLLRLRDGDLEVVADLAGLAPGLCNDLHVDASGRAYIGNMGSDIATQGFKPTVLLRVDPDGAISTAADGLVFPNGTVITQGGELLIAETFAFRITAFDVAPDGSLANRRSWAEFGAPPAVNISDGLSADAVAPDGMCLDTEGALWVADAKGTAALRVAEGGDITARVELDGPTAYGCALGGADGRTLFIAAAPRIGATDPAVERQGALLTTRVDVPGIGWS